MVRYTYNSLNQCGYCFRIPTIDGSDSGNAWPKFTSNKTFPTLLIDSAQPKIIENPFQEKYAFWSQLLKFDQNSSKKSPDIHTEL